MNYFSGSKLTFYGAAVVHVKQFIKNDFLVLLFYFVLTCKVFFFQSHLCAIMQLLFVNNKFNTRLHLKNILYLKLKLFMFILKSLLGEKS